jgi:hypothetical protein
MLGAAPDAVTSNEAPSADVVPSPSRGAQVEQTSQPPLSAASELPEMPGKSPHIDRLEMSALEMSVRPLARTGLVQEPDPVSDLERSEPTAAERRSTQATLSPAELALIKLERLLESPEGTSKRSLSGERLQAGVLTCASPPPCPVVLPQPKTQGELARTAGANLIQATRRRSRRLGRKAATLVLAASGAMIGAVSTLQRDSPGLPEALRFQEPTTALLDAGVAKRSEALASANRETEAAPPAVASEKKPVEAAAPVSGAVIEPSAEAVEAAPATTAVVPVVAPPPGRPPQLQSLSEPPLSAAPEPPERPGKHGKHRNSARRPKTPPTAVVTSTANTAPAEAAASAPSGNSPPLGVFHAFFKDLNSGH